MAKEVMARFQARLNYDDVMVLCAPERESITQANGDVTLLTQIAHEYVADHGVDYEYTRESVAVITRWYDKRYAQET